MRRRDFLAALGSLTVACPLAASAQRSERRIGMLLAFTADDPEGQARLAAFKDGLQQLGWTDGRNVRIDARWPAGDADRRRYAAELVALAPDVILASSSVSVAALQQAPDCDGQPTGGDPSGPDHLAGDAVPYAECLSVPILPREWRPRFLRA
jgi:hypothetical protein